MYMYAKNIDVRRYRQGHIENNFQSIFLQDGHFNIYGLTFFCCKQKYMTYHYSENLNLLSIEFEMTTQSSHLQCLNTQDKVLIKEWLNRYFQTIGAVFMVQAKLKYAQQLISLVKDKTEIDSILQQIAKELKLQSKQKEQILRKQQQSQFKINAYIQDDDFRKRRLAIRGIASNDVNRPVYQQIIGAIERQKRLQNEIHYLKSINQDLRNTFRDLLYRQTAEVKETVIRSTKEYRNQRCQKCQQVLLALQVRMKELIDKEQSVRKKINQFREIQARIIRQWNRQFLPDKSHETLFFSIQMDLLKMRRNDFDFIYKNVIFNYKHLSLDIQHWKQWLKFEKMA